MLHPTVSGHNMRVVVTILLVFFTSIVFASEQTYDKLIYNSDTMYTDTYPLEKLLETDSLISKRFYEYHDSVYRLSGCWIGQVIGTWLIKNDSLFLTDIKSGCEDITFNLDYIFGNEKVVNHQVFVYWYSGNLKAGFGKWIQFDFENWENIYSKTFDCLVKNGLVSNLTITSKPEYESAPKE